MILQIKFYKNVNLSVLHFDPEIRILETTEENTKIQEIRFLRDGAKQAPATGDQIGNKIDINYVRYITFQRMLC